MKQLLMQLQIIRWHYDDRCTFELEQVPWPKGTQPFINSKRKMNQITCWKPFWPKDGSRVNFNFVSTPRNKKEKNNHGRYFHLAQKEKITTHNWNKNTRFQLHVSTTTFQPVSVNCLHSGFKAHVKQYMDKMFLKCSNPLFNDVIRHNSFH